VYPAASVAIGLRLAAGSHEVRYGGGDPDRTGDPRLMRSIKYLHAVMR